MLKELYIRNVAIIKEQRITFSPRFNVLTGETGAGKSIIIGSIALICGTRSSKEMIRSGEDSAFVSALFSQIPDSAEKKLMQLGISCDGGEAMLSRELNDGGGTARINGRAVPVSLLRDAAMILINIHGQHQSQALLCEENHIDYLDAFSNAAHELEQYSALYNDALRIKSRIASLTRDEREKQRRIEILKFQIDDINFAAPKENEEENLIALRMKIQSAEKLSKIDHLITRALYRTEKGYTASDLAKKATEALTDLVEIMPKANEYIDYLTEFTYKCEEIADEVSKECDTGVKNPTDALDKIEERLDTLKRLQHKYGTTVEEILKFRDDAKAELEEIETSDEKIEELTDELNGIRKQMSSIAGEITAKRKTAAEMLEARMEAELKYLEMIKVRFKVEVERSETFTPKGVDQVRFLISANAGEPLAPLSKIASGGELSRTMLALKCALADKEQTPTLIFDEIDTGISGKTSYKIGKKLVDCAKTSQVICVTHSPQIAAQADMHLHVSKHEVDGRTQSTSKILDREGRINEIARIIGAEKITDKTLTAATEMLDEASGK
ncbi:MAG: DNA repair protein RecN [Clostridia bacterium]|nr:DNA repair protein RecN [Clostridia bacterium]